MQYFQHIRVRLAFPLMQEHCSRNNLPTAQGWERLEEKLISECQISDQRASEIDIALAGIFNQTIAAGHRAVRLFRIDEDFAASTFAVIESFDTEESAYSVSYPNPVSTDQLDLVSNEMFLCHKESNGSDERTFVFCTKRVVEERDTRSRNDIGDEAIHRFGWEQYDEFVLVRRRFIQTYEVVKLNRRAGTIELRVEVHQGVDTNTSLQQLQGKLNSYIGATPTVQSLVYPVNLFPAINAIYSAPKEGCVVELGFTTDTGSAKHEKMRSGRQDLRTELFHVGGKAAVNGMLTPYRIAVRWADARTRIQEEALLPGSIRQLGSAEPFLDHMVLSGSMTGVMMNATIARVISYLP